MAGPRGASARSHLRAQGALRKGHAAYDGRAAGAEEAGRAGACQARRWRAGALALALALALQGWRAEAAHADLTGELYQDAKAVIEDLLSAEITRALVPQIVCRAGRQEELATPDDCQHRLSEADPAAVCLPVGQRFQIVRLRMLEHFPATLQALYSRRLAALGSTTAHEVIEVAAGTFYQGLRGDLDQLEQHLAAARDPKVRLALEFANELAPPADTVLSPLPAPALAACLTQVETRFAHGVSAQVSQLDRECTPSSGDNALECELAGAVRLALRGQAEPAQARVRRAVALWIAHAMLARVPVSADGSRELVKPLADEVTGLLLALERHPPALDADSAGPAATALAGFARGAGALIEQHCGGRPGDCPPASAAATTTAAATSGGANAPTAQPSGGQASALAAAWRTSQPALLRVAARLRAITSDGDLPLTLQLLLSDLAETLTGPGSLCDRVDRPACRLLTELDVRIGRRSLVWPAVAAASSGDLRGVAHLVLSSMFSRDTAGRGCDRQSNDEGCRRDSFRRFADSLVMYVLDAARGDSSDAVRTVFRQSAAEAIRFVSPFGGLDRAGWFLPWAPELALRASWNASYRNDSEGHLRTVASVAMVRFRKVFWYTDRSYAALQVSLLDPLAPLAELALRADRDPGSGREVTYRRESMLLWNALTPRVEWTAALPWLSKHLALGVGASLRLVAPTDRRATDSGVDYTYRGLGGPPWYEHVEVGIGLKYLP